MNMKNLNNTGTLHNALNKKSKVTGKLLFLFLCFLFISFAGYMFFINNKYISSYDEGITIYGACRILDGEIIYKDFWTVYAPGQFYILAGLFKLFGTRILTERVYSILIHILLAACAYFLAKRFSGRWAGLFVVFLTLLWIMFVPLYGLSLYPSLLLGIVSCIFTIKFIDTNKFNWLTLAGICTGLTILVRHDLGLYTYIAETITIILFIYRSSIQRSVGKKLVVTFRNYFVFVTSTGIVVLPVALLLLIHVGSKELIWCLITVPITILSEFRSLPYPSLISSIAAIQSGQKTLIDFIQLTAYKFIFYIPVILFFCTLQIVFLNNTKGNYRKEQWGKVLMILVGILFFHYTWNRTDLLHMVAVNIIAFIMLAACLFQPRRYKSGKHPSFLQPFFIILSIITIIVLIQYAFVATSSRIKELVNVNIERARCVRTVPSEAKTQELAVNYIQRHVPLNEKIFVCNAQHQNILINDIAFYFLSERHCAGKFHELHPGVATTLPVQEYIINELEKHSVNYIVVVTSPAVVSKEPNKSSRYSGVAKLDNYIRTYFTAVERFGYYIIAKRRKIK